ncbi:uncharacterized protein PHALS_02632 [Plasmopara halstedii]|uniref:Uncharacterized protein n=1 Tax=Plasmopara halstedii TaxID=4781 RepID=A0A0P1AX51_PLAHL|nr:uncharacterized protein PHALS_02632 [Plasmopara halstedii]CEG46217.1 hypothetical protein PHALS_02632 [Plasmopara halstedii]|eukprot:XP_024582586.1 hypothetical protein PHALS_02632 [Plasmopara halstedii]
MSQLKYVYDVGVSCIPVRVASRGISSDMTTSHRMQRDLARALLDPQSGGVTTYIQECVHSTSIGVDATLIFVQQVIEELNDAIDEYLPFPPDNEPLSHDHEVELGTLLSAASLTIRYVTEKQAMLPLLQQYRKAFDKVLQYPVWTHKCFYELKAVALMGTTRVLESFSNQVSITDVLKQLRWLETLYKGESIGTEQLAHRMNTLLRPLCEFVAVALQTHVAARDIICDDILTLLLQLLTKVDTSEVELVVADVVKVELAATAAVLLEARYPFTVPNAFALLSLPTFVEEMEAEEVKSAIDNAMFTSTSKIARVDDDEEKLMASRAFNLEKECCKVFCGWLAVDTRRIVAAQALAVVYRVVACDSTVDLVVNSDTTPLHEVTNALNDAEFTVLGDFDFVNSLLETIRDICLFQHKLSPITLEDTFQVMSTIMSRLESALKSFPKTNSVERRSAKAACSTIRHTLVEAFLAWLHHPDAANLLLCQIDFLHNVAGTLADPRVYGDVLVILRASSIPEARIEYTSGCQLAVETLCEAINQLDRYSQSTVNRIVSGLTRIAAACRQDIHLMANKLVLPLIPSMLDGSQWGKFLRLRTEAVATVLIGCVQSDEFMVENHPWISDFISFLFNPVVSSENVHSLMILNGLVRTDQKLLEHVASYCIAHPRTISETLHEPLVRWPLYEEDEDLVVATLELLEVLLSVKTLRASVDVDNIYAVVVQLLDNAAREKLDATANACRQVMKSFGSKQDHEREVR